MIKKILIGLAALVAAILVLAAFQGTDFKIERTAVIAAKPAKVFAIVNDIRKWNDWSPWSKLDPGMKTTYSGPSKGVGAKQAWSGNKKVGEGSMTMTASHPNEHIAFQLEFLRPMKDTSQVDFTFKPEGKGTAVAWTMTGKKKYIAKVMCLFMSMDKMVGPDFERGLAGLKALAEAAPKGRR